MAILLLVATAVAAVPGYWGGGTPVLIVDPASLASADAGQDPGDPAYRDARAALNRGDFAAAAAFFSELRLRYPRSRHVANALYWEAFARYRSSRADQLRSALVLLDTQRREHGGAATRADAADLEIRIRGELARQGDRAERQRVSRFAPDVTSACAAGEGATAASAMNALQQADPERALPLLQLVLLTGICDAGVRERAVFLAAQHPGAEGAALLMEVARRDPVARVREAAVFWLARSGSGRVLNLLDELVRTGPAGVRERAVFALAQHRSPRAEQVLRSVVLDGSLPGPLRSEAIVWLARRSAGAAAFLRDASPRLETPALRERVIAAVGHRGDTETVEWLVAIASDRNLPVAHRREAIRWLAVSKHPRARRALTEIIAQP
jgi:HEAT repeat protein